MESKNNHVVRKYGFHYRYDTPEELKVLRKLWKTVCLRMNLFIPTRKPIGWNQDSVDRRKRVYDTPATPLDRLLASGIRSRTQIKELQQLRDSTNPAELTRDILRYRAILTDLAKNPTEALTISTNKTTLNIKPYSPKASKPAAPNPHFALKLNDAQLTIRAQIDMRHNARILKLLCKLQS